MPFADEAGWDVPRFTAEGQGEAESRRNPWLNLESIHPNYFETLGVKIARGRAFAASDRKGAVPVVIVSEDVAAQVWPGRDPIGKRMKMGGPESRGEWRTVVGVARPTRYRDLVSARPTLYLPASQFIDAAQGLVVRTTAPLEAISRVARTEVDSLGAAISVLRVNSFGALLERPLARPRFNALVLSAFASVALLLAAVGLYAVTAAAVRQRRSEIALHMAVGAQPADVRRLVIGETVRVVGAGAVVGLAGAAATTRVVAHLAHLPTTGTIATTAGAVIVLFAAAALATYWPLREAMRLDAASVLRD